MMTQKTGALIFDETADRYDIRFDIADYYGGFHLPPVNTSMHSPQCKPP